MRVSQRVQIQLMFTDNVCILPIYSIVALVAHQVISYVVLLFLFFIDHWNGLCVSFDWLDIFHSYKWMHMVNAKFEAKTSNI